MVSLDGVTPWRRRAGERLNESILNRLVAGAEIIALEGDNMRLTT